MPSIEKMLAYAKSKHRKVRYSMAYPQRLGPIYLDCSSFVYYSLIAGGYLPPGAMIGNTETLYQLKGTVLTEIYSYEDIKAGDIFIRGYQGRSSGAAGHTGIFTRKGEIIHCNAVNNTVTINNESSYISYFLDMKRSNKERYFRPTSSKLTKALHTSGIATVHKTTNVRTAPTTSAPIVATYPPGSKIRYDRIIGGDGYVWLSYIGSQSGERRYTAYKDNKGNQWMDI